MSVVQRRAAVVVALSAVFTAVPSLLAAQSRGAAPGSETPRLLVATFRSSGGEPRVGVEAAEAVRTRVQRGTPVRELFVIPRAAMNAFLAQSGFPADSALGLQELGVLAKSLRADEIVDGEVTKTSSGISLSARLVIPTNIGLVQPLPLIVARNADDAAKQLERLLEDARSSVGDFRRCARALASQQYAAARAAAQQAIARYPASTLGRLCLMDAYTRQQQPMDSVIGAALSVLSIDSTSVLALTNLADAYRAKGDTARAVVALQQLVVFRPDLRPQLVQVLGQLGQPKIAIPIVRDLLRETPGDPDLLRLQWLFLLADEQWRDALGAGAAYVRADSSAATVTYFTRATSAALADGQTALAIELATSGMTKFPNSAPLWAVLAQSYRRAGRIPRAIDAIRRALAIDPATENGWPFLLVAQIESEQVDSALASARQAVAGGADAPALGRVLEVALTTAAKRADAEKSRAGWMEVVRIGAAIDSIASTPNTQFLLGLGAFQVGLDALQRIDVTRRCDEAMLAERMWLTASLAMPRGAQAGAEQRETAGRVMTAIGKYDDAIAQARTALCKAP